MRAALALVVVTLVPACTPGATGGGISTAERRSAAGPVVLTVDVGTLPSSGTESQESLSACVGAPAGFQFVSAHVTASASSTYDTGLVEVTGEPASDPELAATRAVASPDLDWACWTEYASGAPVESGTLEVTMLAPEPTGSFDFVVTLGHDGRADAVLHKTANVGTPDHPVNHAYGLPDAGPEDVLEAAAQGGTLLAVSSDGELWTWTEAAGWDAPVPLPFDVDDFRGLTTGGGSFCLWSAHEYGLSPDAATWDWHPHPLGTPTDMVHDGSEWLAHVYGMLWGDLDGDPTDRTPSLSSLDLVVGGEGRLLAIGQSEGTYEGGYRGVPTYGLFASTDAGRTWTADVPPSAEPPLFAGLHGAERLLVTRAGDGALTGWRSADGARWDAAPLGRTGSHTSVEEPGLRALQTSGDRVLGEGLVGAWLTWHPREGFALQHQFLSAAMEPSVLVGAQVVAFPALGGALTAETWTEMPSLAAVGALPDGVVGEAYAAALEVGGDAVSLQVSAGALPAGLELADGAIRGTPTEAGDFSATVQARDAYDRTDERVLSLMIEAEGAVDGSSSGGCGCASTGGSAPLAALLGLVGLIARRR